MNKIVAIVAVCVAIIAAGISGVVISMQRSAEARAMAAKVASEETIATKKAREAESVRAAEAAKARSAEAKAESDKAAQAQSEAELEAQKLERENLATKKSIAAEERAAADAEARKAADLKKIKELEHKTAKENADAERAKAAVAADELARAEATKAIREAETLKLKVSMAELESARLHYEELNAELLDYQRELDERERALRPEKTIADLSWLPDEDTEVDENGKAKPRKKKMYLAENDASLPKETRELAKANRVRSDADKVLADNARSRVLSRLEPLYVAAVKEDRVVDAKYYREVIKSMYPDWEYKAPESKEEAKEEVKK